MAKRMTDTDKWKKPFIKSLPIEYKCFWFYILDDCDIAGVWQVDIEVAEIRLGVKLSLQKARGFFNEKVVEFDNGTKWFIPDFIDFQYGGLNEKNKLYNSIFSVLNKYSLMGHLSPINGVKDKDKVKDKYKDIYFGKCENLLQFPTSESFTAELQEVHIGSIIELVKIMHRVDIDVGQVQELWKAFKVQNLTGKKFYKTDHDVFSHFINWAKLQPYGKLNPNGSGVRKSKQATADQLADYVLGRKGNS